MGAALLALAAITAGALILLFKISADGLGLSLPLLVGLLLVFDGVLRLLILQHPE